MKYRIQDLKFKIQDAAYLLLPLSCWIIVSCSSGSSNNGNSSVKFDQYYIQGEKLYEVHCSNCHQKTGVGLGLVYPPLNRSDFMEENFTEVICMIRYGREGELIVNGNSYIQSMPGIPTLTDLEVAEIATYIYNTWDHKRGIVEVKEVTSVLNACNK
jgi:mono/diheme cytochrome c family protein